MPVHLVPRVIAIALLAVCSGAGLAATRDYGVTSFDRLQVEGPFEVHVRVGGSPAAHATGSPQALDRLSVEQHSDTLVIKPLPGGWGGWPGADAGKLIVDVSAPAIEAATLAGSGSVSIDRIRGDRLRLVAAGSGDLAITAVDVTELATTMSGSGDVTIAGRARQANVLLTGSGNFQGEPLFADDAMVSLTGTGNLAIAARHTAKATLAGAGNITISGPATCAISRSGSGDVRCAHRAAND